MEKQHNEKDEKKLVGITASKKDDFSEWYTQVILKSGFTDYSAVSGCIIFRPYSYAVWEKVQEFFNKKIKKMGVQNAYFPMFIPESLLKKEKDHVEGFTPEVAWVTEAGDSQLGERLAVRPTSETIMYDSYSKWIRSHNDLPLKINQWCNVVRWEFKHPVPFLRTREFLWQEGHTAFADKESAEKEVTDILDIYAKIFEELLAIPVVKGRKSEREKFAGAEYSTSVETFLPIGKAIQGATSHHLGQNFAKAFEISFLDKNGEREYVWQNSWGISTRILGVMVMMHGDDKGLVLPPKIAPTQVVIVPIMFEKDKVKIIRKANELKEELSSFSVEVDERDNYTPGWKFNEWEMKGVPIRIEIGPKDFENKQVVVVRRDTSAKEFVKWASLKKRVDELLDEIQDNLFTKAKENIEKNTVSTSDWDEFLAGIRAKKWIRAAHCGTIECEDTIKDETEGVKTNCIPFEENLTFPAGNVHARKPKGFCIKCKKPAVYTALFAKSY